MSPVKAKEIINTAWSVSKLTENIGSSSNTKMSMTVVYNHNGKRIVISKKLAETLKLSDEAQISFLIDEGIVMLAKLTTDDEEKRISLTLKDEFDSIKGTTTGKKIAYNAEATYVIATNYGLDYSKCSSKSFDKIDIDKTDPDNPIAMITIKKV